MPDLFQDAASLRQQGKHAEAAQIYQQILRAEPRNFAALYTLGLLLLECDQLDGAANLIGQALAINPAFIDGNIPHGIALIQLRRYEEAIACFDRVLAVKPYFVEALTSRATALLEMNRLDEALEAFDRVLTIKPDHALTWNNRGNTFVAMRRLEEAVESFDRALAINPSLATAVNNRGLALLELKRVNRIPADAVRLLFDDYAATFDAAMMGALNKRDHIHLRAFAGKTLSASPAPLRILDLGCGTGLSGDAFKELAAGGRLDGIDLSPGMIAQARRRNIYDDLIVGDFETFLPALDQVYNLAIAVDALNYLGDLKPTLEGVNRVLEPGGYFLFTVEKQDDGNWRQTDTNRFRHSEAYLRAEAARTGFLFADTETCLLRSESEEMVAGLAVALRKPAAS